MAEKKIKLEWKLEDLLQEKGVNATQLAYDLERLGVNLSISQVGRITYATPQKLNADFLVALVRYFDCDIGDILSNPEPKKRTRPRKKKKRNKMDLKLVWKAQRELEISGLTYRELSAELEVIGVQYDYSTLYRVINNFPKRIDIEFLEGAMQVFNCELEDLVDVE